MKNKKHMVSSLQSGKSRLHRWCDMCNGRASWTQQDKSFYRRFERVTRGFKKVETGFFKSGDRLPQE